MLRAPRIVVVFFSSRRASNSFEGLSTTIGARVKLVGEAAAERQRPRKTLATSVNCILTIRGWVLSETEKYTKGYDADGRCTRIVVDGIDGKEKWMGETRWIRDGKGRRREEEAEGGYILLRLAAGAPSCSSEDCLKEQEGTTPDG